MAKKVFTGFVSGSFSLGMARTLDDFASYCEQNEKGALESWPVEAHGLRPPRRAIITVEIED